MSHVHTQNTEVGIDYLFAYILHWDYGRSLYKKKKGKNENISEEKQPSEVRVGRAQLHSRVPVSHDSVTVSQHAQYQEPETESRWMELSHHHHRIIYT